MTKVFICDDDEGILDVTKIILEEKGYEVSIILDCTTLIKRAESEKPAVILLDLWMPEINGEELTKQLKSNTLTRDIKIIIISANKDTEKIAKLAGADDFIHKPFDIDELEKTLAKYALS